MSKGIPCDWITPTIGISQEPGLRVRLVAVCTLAIMLALGAALLTGCESPAAQRERAKAERVQAEALAYQIRSQADSEAAAERAAVRQMERDAAHQRALETLPYLVAIGGGMAVLLFGVFIVWDLRMVRQAQMGGPGPALWLRQLEMDRLERERELWHAVARLERQAPHLIEQSDRPCHGGESC